MSDDGAESLIALLEGVQHFSTEIFPSNQALFAELADHQAPHTLFITCADSRVSPGLITQTQPGSLFVLRNIGNIVPPYGAMLGGVSAAIEYAVSALRVKNIVICGHSDCGAMKAMLDPHTHRLETMPTVGRWLGHAQAALATTQARKPEHGGQDVMVSLVEQNVLLQLNHLRTHPAVAAALAEGRLRLQGWFYDIGDGAIWVLDETTREAMSVQAALRALP